MVVLELGIREEVRHHGALARLAAEQYGVVAHRQLLELGYSTAAVHRGLVSGRLHRVHRGIYAVGHAGVTEHGRCLAAVLSASPDALLSHDSAGWLWGLLQGLPRRLDVTTPVRGHSNGIRMHHSTILEASDRSIFEGIPVTSVPRTLLDLAAGSGQRFLANVIHRAERLDLLDLAKLDDLLERCGRHRGRKKLGAALGIYRDPAFIRALQERLFLAVAKGAGLPRPAMNTFVAGHEIDAYWEAEQFAVEVDGWESHRTRAAFESDRLRQEDLKLAGIDSIRISARRVEREPDEVASRLVRLLEMRREELPRNRPPT